MAKLTFGERVKTLLVQRGMTQGQLALRSGVKQGHISAIIRGDRHPRYDIAAALACALDVSLDWLATGEPWRKEELTPDEDALLADYRNASADVREIMLMTVRSLSGKKSP